MPSTVDKIPEIRLIRTEQLKKKLGDCCTMTVDRMVRRDPSFPRPIKLAGSSLNFFVEHEVDEYIERQKRQQNAKGAK